MENSDSALGDAFEAEWQHIQARLLAEPKFAADFNRVFIGMGDSLRDTARPNPGETES